MNRINSGLCLGVLAALGMVAAPIAPGAWQAAGATTGNSADFLTGGAAGSMARIDIGGRRGQFAASRPAVVTPSRGGTVDKDGAPIERGGYPPFYPPTVVIGPSEVHSDGSVSGPDGGRRLVVHSRSMVAGFTFLSDEASIRLTSLSSQCTADDSERASSHTADTTLFGVVGGEHFNGPVAPNTTIVVPFADANGPHHLTIVLNEQVAGQTAEHRDGILVNAVHLYVDRIDATYRSDGDIEGQSRCEVDESPSPPGVVPEVPAAVMLPVSVGLVGLVYLGVGRRRRRRSS